MSTKIRECQTVFDAFCLFAWGGLCILTGCAALRLSVYVILEWAP